MKLPIVPRKSVEVIQSQLEQLHLEYQNYRRRNEKVRENAYQQGKLDAVTELLGVYDNLLLALNQPCSDTAFLAGIEITMSAMKKTLETMGITEIPALGAQFDPRLHEAMEHLEDTSLGEGVVTRVIRTGFQQDDRVLRYALVTVAN